MPSQGIRRSPLEDAVWTTWKSGNPRRHPSPKGSCPPRESRTLNAGGTLARILTDFSHKALADAIEQNCIDFFMEWGRGPGCEVHEDRGVTWFATGVPDPLFNGVMTAQLAPEEVGRRIDDLLAEFRNRGLPLEWTVGSSTVPQDLGRHLQSKGLTHRQVVPGMAMELAKLPEEPLPRNLTIDWVENRRDLEVFIRIFAATFRIDEALVPRLMDIRIGMPPSRREKSVAFLGRLDGRAVASTELFASAGVAGLYSVGTLPAARGRGLGRAMTAAALREGRSRGYRIGALQGTEMGVPVYRRLGFREYSRFEIYT
jgi:GNAT superfamily N-acetyltransferase